MHTVDAKSEIGKYETLILYGKFLYYCGHKVGLHSPFSDQEYDDIESKYLKICSDLEMEPKLQKMVGFDMEIIRNADSVYFWDIVNLLHHNDELKQRIKKGYLHI